MTTIKNEYFSEGYSSAASLLMNWNNTSSETPRHCQNDLLKVYITVENVALRAQRARHLGKSFFEALHICKNLQILSNVNF